MTVPERAAVLHVATAFQQVLPDGADEKIVAFIRRLLEWNERINLTGARSLEEVIGEHLPDSFAMARLVPSRASVVDVGTGGGLPALPFSILRPDCHTLLVEPRAKRVAFLRMAICEMGLTSVTVKRERVSDGWQAGLFDVAASRATFPPDEWLAKGLGLVNTGGRVIVFSVEPWSGHESRAHLVDASQYATLSGRPRWAAAFCST